MRNERTILAYKTYFMDFISTLNENEIKKIFYVIDMLKVQERISTKFVKFIRDGLYELRVSHNNNIYRVFFGV